MIGGILSHAGIDGFLTNRAELYEQADTETAQWETFLRTLHEAYQGGAFTSNVIAHDIEAYNLVRAIDGKKRMGEDARRGEQVYDALPAALVGTMGSTDGKEPERSLSIKIGKCFANRVQTRYGEAGWHIMKPVKDPRSGTKHYRIACNANAPKNANPHQKRAAEVAEVAEVFPPLARKNVGEVVRKKERTEEKYVERAGNTSATSATSAGLSLPGFGQNRDILNHAKVDGTSALQLSPQTQAKHVAPVPTASAVAVAEAPPDDLLETLRDEVAAINYATARVRDHLRGGSKFAWDIYCDLNANDDAMLRDTIAAVRAYRAEQAKHRPRKR